MITSKTPLRVSLFGGGTDYPNIIDRMGGAVLGGTIDKYIHIIAHPLSSIAEENIRLSYRKVESVRNFDEISHPIVREYLKLVQFAGRYAFYTVSDIPGSSGLGSSSSFTVGFINLIDQISGIRRSRLNLAKSAIHLERNILGEPVGVQDQFHAAFGGFAKYSFSSNDVSISQVSWSQEDYDFLSKRAVLVHTGGFRKVHDILSQDDDAWISITKDRYLQRMIDLVDESYNLLKSGISLSGFSETCELLNESWRLKRSLSQYISNDNVDNMIAAGLARGAYAAKLLGAGGDGFILFLGDENLKNLLTADFSPRSMVDFKFVEAGSVSSMSAQE